tara:strand:+ start:1200 stop:1520 length:321 start_codon:yes stop_codon:yes gene_type:complete
MIMETNRNRHDEIEAAINSGSLIKDSKVSLFFKDRTMQLLFPEKELEKLPLSWFTPKFQLAILFCFLALNIYTYTQVNTLSYTEGISEFAEIHGLSTPKDNSLFNQ